MNINIYSIVNTAGYFLCMLTANLAPYSEFTPSSQKKDTKKITAGFEKRPPVTSP